MPVKMIVSLKHRRKFPKTLRSAKYRQSLKTFLVSENTVQCQPRLNALQKSLYLQ